MGLDILAVEDLDDGKCWMMWPRTLELQIGTVMVKDKKAEDFIFKFDKELRKDLRVIDFVS